MPTKYLSKVRIEKICRKQCSSLSPANLQRLINTIMLAQRIAAQKGPGAVHAILQRVL